jgi:hypothetical protein
MKLLNPPVIGGKKVNKLMHDNELAQVLRKLDQFGVQGKTTDIGDGRPFSTHLTQVNLRRLHADSRCPVAHCPAKPFSLDTGL